MIRKLLCVMLFFIFFAGSFASANSVKLKGLPFLGIWEKIENHEERITELEERVDDIEYNTAYYTVDSQRCLRSENSEGIVTYSNGTNISQTLIWNCADYKVGSTPYGDQHIELFFKSTDGQCLRKYGTYVSEGICDTPYYPPETPVFQAKITDFKLKSGYYEECSPFGGYCDKFYYVSHEYIIENSGNTTLFDLSASLAINSGEPFEAKTFQFLPVAESASANWSTNAGWNITQPKTYTVTLYVKMWDGSILDSQTKTITVVP